MPGIETTRFKQQPLNPNFVCSICRGVFVEPVQRPSCQHIFCKECITNWLVHQNTCPIDRQPLTRNYLIDAPRVLRELISELEVKCEFHTRGCDRYLKMDEHDGHAAQCMYNPNFPIKAKFETILRAKEIITGSHSCVSQLLNILEEKEKLVREQERLITKILEEGANRKSYDLTVMIGEDINKMMREFTNEKERMQKEREEDMQKFKDVIARLQKENEELKGRLTENSLKLITEYSYPITDEDVISNPTNDPWIPLNSQAEPEASKIKEPLEKSFANNFTGTTNITVFASSSAQNPFSPNHRCASATVRSISRDRNRSHSRDRSKSRERPRPRSSSPYGMTSSASPAGHGGHSQGSRGLMVKAEHKEVVRRLKSSLPETVYRAMQRVDLADFYDIEPYKLNWASYIGERVKREAILVKRNDKVLVMCCWSDLYIPTCLAEIVGDKGLVVTRGYAQNEIDRVSRAYSHLVSTGRLIIVLEDEEDSVLKEGYPEKSPYDVIFVPREHYTPEIEEQRKPLGIVYDPYQEIDLTPKYDREKINQQIINSIATFE